MFILQLSYSHRNVDTFHMLRRLSALLSAWPTCPTDVDYKFSSSLSISIMNEKINIMHIAPAPLTISHVVLLSVSTTCFGASCSEMAMANTGVC